MCLFGKATGKTMNPLSFVSGFVFISLVVIAAARAVDLAPEIDRVKQYQTVTLSPRLNWLVGRSYLIGIGTCFLLCAGIGRLWPVLIGTLACFLLSFAVARQTQQSARLTQLHAVAFIVSWIVVDPHDVSATFTTLIWLLPGG